MKRRIFLFLAIILSFSLLMACEIEFDFGGGSTKGKLMDPYDAYKLTQGEDRTALSEAINDKPPASLVLKPVFYHRDFYELIPLDGEELVLEKGKSVTFSLDEILIHQSGEEYPIQATVVIKYDGKKEGDLFHSDSDTYGNPTLVIDGYYISEYRQHNVKDAIVRFTFIDEDNYQGYSYQGLGEEVMEVRLAVDLGEASQGDGNIGYIYFQILQIKR